MNKAQLVDELTARFDGNRKAAQHALESVLDVIERGVVKGEKVVITGFGAFEKVERAARNARNPRTGDRVRVRKTSVPKFRPGTEFKAVVSGAKKLPRVAATTAKTATGRGGSSTATRSAGASKSTSRGTASKSSPAKKSAAKKTTAKKATAKSTAKKTTRASSSTTRTAKAPAKSTTRKATTRKSAASKATSKRAAKKS